MKKITKLLLAFLLIGSVVYTGDLNANEVNADTSVVMPDLSDYEMPEELVNDSAIPAQPTTRTSSTLSMDRTMPKRGLDNEMEIPEGAKPATGGMTKNDEMSRAMNTGAIGSSQTILDTYVNGTKSYKVIKAAETTNTRVFIREDNVSGSGGYDAYQKFKPTGTTPSVDALAVANEFEKIYSMMNPIFGDVHSTWGSSKINIILSDIGEDGNGFGGYTAGYFTSLDLIGNDPAYYDYSNEDTIVYMDVGKNHGFTSYENAPVVFYATLAHEYQHLINGSYLIGNSTEKFPSDRVATWYNEGLSGLAASLYYESKGIIDYRIDNGAYLDFIANFTPNGVGYVPTDDQWNAAGSRVYSLYGSTQVLMNDFNERKDSASAVTNLVKSNKVGYNNSLCNVAMNYSSSSSATQTSCTKDFDAFFTRAVLNFSVDSPNGGTSYSTNLVPNSWEDRALIKAFYQDSDAYFGMDNGVENENYSYDSKYYSNVFLTNESIGTNTSAVEVEIPTNTSTNAAKYFIVTPDAATGINTIGAWTATNKIVGELKPGKQTVIVGTDNMFSIVAVNTTVAADQTFTYKTITPIFSANDEIAPATTGVAPQATVADTTEYTGSAIVWKDGSGKVVTGNFLPDVEYTAEVTLTAKTGFYFDETAVVNITNGGAAIDGLEVVSTDISAEFDKLTYVLKFPATTGYLTIYDGVVAPVTGVTPAAVIEEAEYTGTISWSLADGSPLVGVIEPGTVYFAEYTLTAAPNYIWDDAVAVSVLNGTVTDIVVDPSDSKENTLTFKVEYAAEKPVVEVPETEVEGDGLVKTGMVSYFSILAIISLALISSRKFLRK